MRTYLLPVLFSTVLFVSSTAFAAKSNIVPAKSYQDIPLAFLKRMSADMLFETYMSNVVQQFSQIADREGSLTRDFIDKTALRAKRNRQNQQISQLIKFDENKDGIITEAEATLIIDDEQSQRRRNDSYLPQNQSQRMLENVMKHDLDKDGRVTFKEMTELPVGPEEEMRYMQDRNPEEWLGLDMNNDGVVKMAEVRKTAEDNFKIADANGNLKIDREEFQQFAEYRNVSILPPSCSLPQPAQGSLVGVLGTYEGQAISTVTLAGQEKETNSAEVNVNLTSHPLYLIVTSYESMVWKFKGNLQNIERLVIAGPSKENMVQSGATGLPKEKISFIDNRICQMPFWHGEEDNRTIGVLAAMLKKKPDWKASSHKLNEASISNAGISAAFLDKNAPSPRGAKRI